MPRTGQDRLTSILAMQLQGEQQRQQQEKAEALQREQMSDAKLQQYLNTMQQTSQMYFGAAQKRDDEERKRAVLEVEFQRGLQKEQRDKEQHEADLLFRVEEATTRYGRQEELQEDVQAEARAAEESRREWELDPRRLKAERAKIRAGARARQGFQSDADRRAQLRLDRQERNTVFKSSDELLSGAQASNKARIKFLNGILAGDRWAVAEKLKGHGYKSVEEVKAAIREEKEQGRILYGYKSKLNRAIRSKDIKKSRADLDKYMDELSVYQGIPGVAPMGERRAPPTGAGRPAPQQRQQPLITDERMMQLIGGYGRGEKTQSKRRR